MLPISLCSSPFVSLWMLTFLLLDMSNNTPPKGSRLTAAFRSVSQLFASPPQQGSEADDGAPSSPHESNITEDVVIDPSVAPGDFLLGTQEFLDRYLFFSQQRTIKGATQKS